MQCVQCSRALGFSLVFLYSCSPLKVLYHPRYRSFASKHLGYTNFMNINFTHSIIIIPNICKFSLKLKISFRLFAPSYMAILFTIHPVGPIYCTLTEEFLNIIFFNIIIPVRLNLLSMLNYWTAHSVTSVHAVRFFIRLSQYCFYTFNMAFSLSPTNISRVIHLKNVSLQ